MDKWLIKAKSKEASTAQQPVTIDDCGVEFQSCQQLGSAVSTTSSTSTSTITSSKIQGSATTKRKALPCQEPEGTQDSPESDREVTEHEDQEQAVANKKRKLWKPKIKTKDVLKDFPWLDDKYEYPFCKLCLTKIVGSKYHLKRHENMASHRNIMQAAKSSQRLTFVTKNDKKTNLIKKAELKMSIFLCVHNLPFLLLDFLPSLQKNIFLDSEICNGVKLKRKKATRLVVEVLAPYFQKQLILDLKINRFAVIIDETTDVSVEKCLIVVVRYWKDGFTKDRILDLIKVESATADDIFIALKTLFDQYNIPYANIIAFASDGASTMMGKISGVQMKFKEIAPYIYVQVCLCHALHLCSSYAAKCMPDVVEQFVRDVYSYFAHSSKRLSELAECQIFANEKPHKMLYASQTRWLSLRAVADRVLEHWNSLILFFQRAALEDNLPNAKSILHALRNPVFKLYLLFLSYILDLITRLNLEMQSESSKLPLILDRFTTLYKVILKNYIKPEIISKNVNAIHTINVNHPHNYLDLKLMYCGAKTEAFLQAEIEKGAISEQDVLSFLKHILGFYIELSNQIKKRFNFDDKHLIFARNFLPSVVKSKERRSIAAFINIFPQIQCDIEAVNTEWQLLAEQNLNDFSDNIAEFWNSVSKLKNTLNEKMFPNLIEIAKVILTLPHSSASAERGFSQLSLNKNKLRNRLDVKTCAAILIVKDYISQNCLNDVNNWDPPLGCLNYRDDEN